MKVYAKNSFDRFGDDLTELIVSYLWFEDKVRLECVSKQWRSLVFNKQFVIEIDNCSDEKPNSLNKLIDSRRHLDQQLLESILKKCPNITDVKLFWANNSSVLSLIGRYCHRIKSLSYYTCIKRDDNSLSFFRNYGHKLEELRLFLNNEDIYHFYRFCPNLKKIWIPNISVLITDDKEFLPKLEHIVTNFPIISKNVPKMKIFTDKYSRTLKTINLPYYLGDNGRPL